MRPWPDWQRQYTRAVRSQGSCRGKIPPRCVPGRQSVAIFSSHASPRGLRTGKSPVRGKIRAPCIRNELALAGYARHASEKPCKQLFGNTPREDLARKGRFSLHGPLESCTARRSCHPSWRKTDRAHATPVPLASAKPTARPRPRHRRTVRAARARSPGPRNTAREAAPPSLPGQQVPPAAPAPPPPLFANTSQ